MLNKKSKSGTMRSVSVECQFLLCLTILRRNYGYQEAAYIFKINNPDIVQCVFKTWLIYMFKVLSDPIIKRKMFVKLEDLPRPLPQPFDNPILNKVRAVIDATLIEVIFKVQNSKNDGSLYSLTNIKIRERPLMTSNFR